MTGAAPHARRSRAARRTPLAPLSPNRAWAVLLASAVLEAVWATVLGSGIGVHRPLATAVFLAALTASMLGLGQAMRSIPIGTAYAVWTGVGAALTVLWAMATGAQAVHWGQLALIVGLVGCTLGLKLVDGADPGRRPRPRRSH